MYKRAHGNPDFTRLVYSRPSGYNLRNNKLINTYFSKIWRLWIYECSIRLKMLMRDWTLWFFQEIIRHDNSIRQWRLEKIKYEQDYLITLHRRSNLIQYKCVCVYERERVHMCVCACAYACACVFNLNLVMVGSEHFWHLKCSL